MQSVGSTEKLHLHHKDHNPNNNEIGNIKLVCAQCHLKAHDYDFHKRITTTENGIKKIQVKISKSCSSLMIIIPAEVVRHLDFRYSDYVELWEESGKIIIAKKE